MSTDERTVDALSRGPLPAGFSRSVFRLEPGDELALRPEGLPNAIWVVEEGAVELVCRAGTRRCFGRGAMIPMAWLPVARLRSIGRGPLVLVAVSRPPRATDEFRRAAGSHGDAENDPGA